MKVRIHDVKYRSFNKSLNKYFYWENGIYYRNRADRDNFSIGLFSWKDAQRYLFSNKFGQEVYVGSTLEGVILGSKVKVVVEEDNFGIAHARCIECKSTENSGSFNLNNVDILWCYNLKVVEDEPNEVTNG